jgi:hypothetical protein
VGARTVLVPAARLPRWYSNFADRHGGFRLTVLEGRLEASAEDGTTATASLPFDRAYGGAADVDAFAAAVGQRTCWGLLLVRKGGFAVARLDAERVVESKVGRRHVQGRTKAGGQSQQRFARRRDNQARQAYEAAAEHAHRILVAAGEELAALVCGGDRTAVDAVLADDRMTGVARLRTARWLAVPDPRRAVLEQAVRDGSAAELVIAQA